MMIAMRIHFIYYTSLKIKKNNKIKSKLRKMKPSKYSGGEVITYVFSSKAYSNVYHFFLFHLSFVLFIFTFWKLFCTTCGKVNSFLYTLEVEIGIYVRKYILWRLANMFDLLKLIRAVNAVILDKQQNKFEKTNKNVCKQNWWILHILLFML